MGMEEVKGARGQDVECVNSEYVCHTEDGGEEWVEKMPVCVVLSTFRHMK